MYKKVDELYINMDNVATIAPYQLTQVNYFEAGLVINGIRHAMLVLKNAVTELTQQELITIRDILVELVHEIVENPEATSISVKDMFLSKLDMDIKIAGDEVPQEINPSEEEVSE